MSIYSVQNAPAEYRISPLVCRLAEDLHPCREAFFAVRKMSTGHSATTRRVNGSRLSRIRSQEHRILGEDYGDYDEPRGTGNRTIGSLHQRQEPSPSRLSFSSSLSQKTPARSYFQRPFHGSHGINSTSQRYSPKLLTGHSSH